MNHQKVIPNLNTHTHTHTDAHRHTHIHIQKIFIFKIICYTIHSFPLSKPSKQIFN